MKIELLTLGVCAALCVSAPVNAQVTWTATNATPGNAPVVASLTGGPWLLAQGGPYQQTLVRASDYHDWRSLRRNDALLLAWRRVGRNPNREYPHESDAALLLPLCYRDGGSLCRAISTIAPGISVKPS